MGSSRLIPWRGSTERPGSVLSLLAVSPRVPLPLRVRRTGEGEGEGSPQGLRGRVGEVEQRTCRHHRVIGIAPGLDGSQKDGVHGLDLRRTRKQLLCIIQTVVWMRLLFCRQRCGVLSERDMTRGELLVLDTRSSDKLPW